MYELFGRVHAALATMNHERGQGTVEYVGLIMLIAAILTVVLATSGVKGGEVAEAVVKKLKGAIEDVGVE